MIEIFGSEGLEELVVRVPGGVVRIPVVSRALSEPRFVGRPAGGETDRREFQWR